MGQRVWVAELSWNGGGTMSVHRSKAGAERRLEKRASELGINLSMIDEGVDDMNSYGLSYMEVER